jgi:hypothetical protein
MSLPNFEHILGPVYMVRTQAGFRQACKHYLGDEKAESCSGYPTNYPSVVCLEYRYMGGVHELMVCSEHVNLVKAKLEKH